MGLRVCRRGCGWLLACALVAASAHPAAGQAPSGPTFDVRLPDASLIAFALWGSAIAIGMQSERWEGSSPCKRPALASGVCDPQAILRLDRKAMPPYWGGASLTSDVLLLSLMATPIGYAGIRAAADDRVDEPGETFGASTAVAMQAYGATLLATNIMKVLFRRPRPFTYDDAFSQEERFDGDARLGHPSGHTSLAFTAAAALSVMLLNELDDDVAVGLGIAGGYLAASTVGYMRMAAHKHFLTDVVMGAALGAGMGYLVTATQVASSSPSGSSGSTGLRVSFGGAF